MFGFFVAWGVFWLLCWVLVAVLGLIFKQDGLTGVGALGTAFSVIYLISAIVGKLLSGV